MFDAYCHWLAIPPHEQPPNEYRLLGLPLFESAPAAIANAAAARTAQLQGYLNSMYGDEAQRLLDEVAAARICLLNPALKASYDQELRAELYGPNYSTLPARAPVPAPTPVGMPLPGPTAIPATPQVATTPPVPPAFLTASSPAPVGVSTTSAPRSRRRNGPFRVLVSIGTGGLTGLALGWLILAYLRPQFDYLNWFHPPSSVAHATPSGIPHHAEQPPQQPTSVRNRPSASPHQRPADPRSSNPPGANRPVVDQPADNPAINNQVPVASPRGAGAMNAPPTNQPAPSAPTERGPAQGEAALAPQLANTTAKRLLALARDSRDSSEQATLLEAALRRATAEQEVQLALEALTLLTEEHSANELELTLDLLQSLDRSDLSPAAQQQIAAHSVALLQRLPANDARGRSLALMTLQAARESRDVQLVRQATLAMIAVQEAGAPNNTSVPMEEQSQLPLPNVMANENPQATP